MVPPQMAHGLPHDRTVARALSRREPLERLMFPMVAPPSIGKGKAARVNGRLCKDLCEWLHTLVIQPIASAIVCNRLQKAAKGCRNLQWSAITCNRAERCRQVVEELSEVIESYRNGKAPGA